MMRLFRRIRKVQAPRLTIVPDSHAGQAGYTVFEDGRRVAWGRTEGAALASYRVSRCA